MFPIWLLFACVLIFMVASYSLIRITTTYLTNTHRKYSYCFHSCCVFLSSLMCTFPLNVAYYIMVCIFRCATVQLSSSQAVLLGLGVPPESMCRKLRPLSYVNDGSEASGRWLNHGSPAFLNGTIHSWTERVLRQWQSELAILRKGFCMKSQTGQFPSVS